MSRTIFTVGRCKVVGGHGRLEDGTTVRNLTVAQYKAAKVLLLGMVPVPALDHDELDDLLAQLCEERKHADRLRAMRKQATPVNRLGTAPTNGNGKVFPAGWPE